MVRASAHHLDCVDPGTDSTENPGAQRILSGSRVGEQRRVERTIAGASDGSQGPGTGAGMAAIPG